MTDVEICERSGIEFAEMAAGGWCWRTAESDGQRFRWVGPFQTKAEAAQDCVGYCQFEFEGDLEHASDCAVHNPPALPAGPCDCR